MFTQCNTRWDTEKFFLKFRIDRVVATQYRLAAML